MLASHYSAQWKCQIFTTLWHVPGEGKNSTTIPHVSFLCSDMRQEHRAVLTRLGTIWYNPHSMVWPVLQPQISFTGGSGYYQMFHGYVELEEHYQKRTVWQKLITTYCTFTNRTKLYSCEMDHHNWPLNTVSQTLGYRPALVLQMLLSGSWAGHLVQKWPALYYHC